MCLRRHSRRRRRRNLPPTCAFISRRSGRGRRRAVGGSREINCPAEEDQIAGKVLESLLRQVQKLNNIGRRGRNLNHCTGAGQIWPLGPRRGGARFTALCGRTCLCAAQICFQTARRSFRPRATCRRRNCTAQNVAAACARRAPICAGSSSRAPSRNVACKIQSHSRSLPIMFAAAAATYRIKAARVRATATRRRGQKTQRPAAERPHKAAARRQTLTAAAKHAAHKPASVRKTETISPPPPNLEFHLARRPSFVCASDSAGGCPNEELPLGLFSAISGERSKMME